MTRRVRWTHGLRLAHFLIVSVLASGATGCGQPFDLRTGLRIVDVATGWFDAGIVEGRKNKLVPTISFKLQNAAKEPVSSVQLNAVFKRVGADGEWDTALLKAIGREGLPPGATTLPLITIRASVGYTGEEPRADMLRNSQFVDVKVTIFAKHGADQWTPLGDFPIERRLLTQ